MAIGGKNRYLRVGDDRTTMKGRDLDVLYLTASMGMGGADKQISLLARGLAQSPIETEIVCLRPLGPMGREVREAGVPITSLDIGGKHELAYKLPRLVQHVRECDPDVIHGHMYHSNMLARVLAPLVGAASISTVHSTYETRDASLPDATLRERLYRYTDRLSDLTTFVSDASRERYVDIDAVSAETAKTVYNGIDTEEFQHDHERRTRIRDELGAEGKFIWLAVGRFVQAKDYPTMIDAFSRISAENAELWILGHGRLEGEVREAIERRGLDDEVTLLGTTEEVQAYMSAADGFVLSSHWEGFGIVVAEAMACELPVVSTECGGPEEIVLDGETGYLCDVKDPDGLSGKLNAVLEMEEQERERMGKRGRERILNEFGIRRIVDEWKGIYSDVSAATER